MAFSIRKLYDLQQVDWDIQKASGTLTDDRARFADESAILAATGEAARLRSNLLENQVASRTAESKLCDLEPKIKSIDDRLYSGNVTSERQYQAMEEERGFLDDQRGEEEDRVLELMVTIEELEGALTTTDASVERLTDEKSTERAELTVEIQQLEEELGMLNQKRTGLLEDIPPTILSTYEALLERRGGHAVARVERGMCEGCRLVLPTGEVSRARSSDTIHPCSSCGRILLVV